MSTSQITVLDKVAREIIKKYDNRKSFQAQGKQIVWDESKGYYKTSLDELDNLVLVKQGDSFALAFANNVDVYATASKDSVTSSENIHPYLEYLAICLSNRLYNRAKDGDSLRIFSGSSLTQSGYVGFDLTLNNFPEKDGYRAVEIKLLINGKPWDSVEKPEGLDMKATVEWLNKARSVLNDDNISASDRAKFDETFKDFAQKLVRVFQSEGRVAHYDED